MYIFHTFRRTVTDVHLTNLVASFVCIILLCNLVYNALKFDCKLFFMHFMVLCCVITVVSCCVVSCHIIILIIAIKFPK